MINPYAELFHALDGQPDSLKLELRKKLIWAFSWAIPSNEAILAIAVYSPILEVGAGSGYWSWLLGQTKARVLATDCEPGQPPHWTPVELGGGEQAKTYPDRALFLCWPPLDSEMAVEALESYRGSTVIYVGEWRGRTANRAFHDALEQGWQLELCLPIPQWPGFKDDLRVFRRLPVLVKS